MASKPRKNPLKSEPVVYALITFTIPLVFILVAAVCSGWFNLYENALSDLGHATRSNVAPLFNIGLSLGGVLIAIGGAKYLRSLSRDLEVLVALLGYSLVLVAVFDEVYGRLHFYVSVLFFVLLALCVLRAATILESKIMRALAVAFLLASIALWILHFAARIPRGAAIPELVSAIGALPFYTALYAKAARKTG